MDLPYKTAWSLALRIRIAMLNDPAQKRLFHGIVEMDETYIGGKPRKGTGEKHKRGRGTDKMPVVGIVERNGEATAKVFEKATLSFKGLGEYCKSHVDTNDAIVVTDEYPCYNGFRAFTQHAVINHKTAYAIGDVHTNTIEGLWALLKRAWYGQHHHYSKKWGDHYITETVYKYNNRHNGNSFGDLIQHMVGVTA